MANSQEIDNTDSLPIAPRGGISNNSGEEQERSSAPPINQKHSFTPVKAMKVQYWHEGEQPVSRKPDPALKKKNHAQRADQFGLLLLGCAVIIVVLVEVTLYLNNKNYLFYTPKVKETSTAVVDFYQGNHAFAEKVAEEKAAKKLINGHEVHGISTVNDDLEVPLSEQMNSMKYQMEKMRSLQKSDEAPPPAPDTGPKVDTVTLRPTEDNNFKAPLEFNKELPKNLQTNQ